MDSELEKQSYAVLLLAMTESFTNPEKVAISALAGCMMDGSSTCVSSKCLHSPHIVDGANAIIGAGWLRLTHNYTCMFSRPQSGASND